MQIYADVVFIINFIMDIFILWTVSKLVKKEVSALRLIIAGATMATIYCMLIFIAPLRVYLNFFSSVVIIMVGVMISFNPKELREFVKLVFLSHISAFAVGGLGMAVFYFTNISDVVGNMVGFTIENFSFKILLSSSCISYIIIKLSIACYRRTLVKKQIFYPVKIFFNEQEISLNALLDTGNSLSDPINNSPVIICEFDAIKNFLPNSLKVHFYENRENEFDFISDNLEDMEFFGRVRMIPFASLGKQHGILIGFRPDKVEIDNDSKIISLSNTIIGIYNFKFSKDGRYKGLLNPEIIEN